jgi:glycosyltransferase involved in cell wall biosynthesis
MRPRISVVIPVWNGESRIAATLDALAAQTAPADSFEVIVVDNGSTDRTAGIVQHYDFVTLLSEPKPGSYRARNGGVAQARGEYILFTDGDCVPAREWVDQALVEISKNHGGIGIWAGQITMFIEEGGAFFSSRYDKLLTGFDQERNAEAGRCVTANWLCRRDTLLEIGGFNNDALSGGDVDCASRFVAAGYRICYAPGMTVGHPTRANLVELVRKRRRVIGGRWTLRGVAQEGMRRAAVLCTQEYFRQAKRVVKSNIEIWAKPGVLMIVLWLLLVSHYELLRLAAGRAPYRS